MRCKFTDQDVLIMENFYKNEPYPTTDQRFELAEQLGKPVKSVSGWFAGRRRKQVQNGEDLSALSKPINQKDTDGLLARLHGTRSIRNIISTNQNQAASEPVKLQVVKSAETDKMIKGAGLDVIKPGDPDSPELNTIRKILDMDTGKSSAANRPERILDSVYIPSVKKALPSISCLRQPVFMQASEPQAEMKTSSPSMPMDLKTQSEVLLLANPKPTLAQFDEDTDEEIDVLSLSEDTEKKMELFDKRWEKQEQKKPSFEILNEEPIDLTSPIRPIPRSVGRQTPVRSNVLRPRALQPNTDRPYPSQNFVRQNPAVILPKPSLPPFTAHGQLPIATNATTHLALRALPAGKFPNGFQAAGMSRQQMVQQLDYLNKQIEWKKRLLNHYISTQQLKARQATIQQPAAAYFNQ